MFPFTPNSSIGIRIKIIFDNWRSNGRFTAFSLLCCFIVIQGLTYAQEKPVRRVLIINQVGVAYPAINIVDQGVRESLSQSRYTVEFYREYLDMFLFPAPADQQTIREAIIRK